MAALSVESGYENIIYSCPYCTWVKRARGFARTRKRIERAKREAVAGKGVALCRRHVSLLNIN
jgi:hypothetical protein